MPARGETVQLVPELAPRLRIDAGGRLVEEQQLRLVEQTRGEREPLLPAARQRTGELSRARGEAEPLEPFADPRLAVAHRVDPGDELEVLGDREVLVQAELLRHVPDAPLDLGRGGADVEAERRAGALVGCQQPAQHPDRGRLAAAVRAEKAHDPAPGHREIDVVHDCTPAIALGKAAHLDRGRSGHFKATSTGCPGCSFGASAALGRASAMKTSFSRRSRL